MAIGTELLLGQIVDTNSAWLGEQLAAAGMDRHYSTTVGDNLHRITVAMRDALARADAVIVCGGLGPTQDDITREAAAAVMNVKLERHDDIAQRIEEMFRSRGREMAANNLLQADVPVGRRHEDRLALRAVGYRNGLWYASHLIPPQKEAVYANLTDWPPR